MNLPRFVVSIEGPGSPIWGGPPSRSRIRAILDLTYTDQDGKRYYRTEPSGSFRKMWSGKNCYNETPESLRLLNAAIDRWDGAGA